MADITAKMVNDLRQKTGVGMMDCKKALVACNGDADAAVDFLRKAGMAKAAKKAGRAANQGKFIVKANGQTTVMVEVLCETDFVAKTADFADFAEATANKALNSFSTDGDISAELAALVADDLKALIAKLGENMHVRRALRWVAAEGCAIGTYLHTGVPYGVMVEVGGEYTPELINGICLHICANSPAYIAPADVPADFIAKEKEIAAAQPGMAGKPANILENILNGKINKLLSDICLMNQPWIDDDKSCLAKIAPKVKVKRFVRVLVGESLGGEEEAGSAE